MPSRSRDESIYSIRPTRNDVAKGTSMSRTPHFIPLLMVGLWAMCLVDQAAAGDHFRKLGIGYGAGYHAPAACGQAATCEKFQSYHHWKNACCHPGPTAPQCGCAPCSATPACAPSCLTSTRGWFGTSAGVLGRQSTPSPGLN
jgi:hypothetical protein